MRVYTQHPANPMQCPLSRNVGKQGPASVKASGPFIFLLATVRCNTIAGHDLLTIGIPFEWHFGRRTVREIRVGLHSVRGCCRNGGHWCLSRGDLWNSAKSLFGCNFCPASQPAWVFFTPSTSSASRHASSTQTTVGCACMSSLSRVTLPLIPCCYCGQKLGLSHVSNMTFCSCTSVPSGHALSSAY